MGAPAAGVGDREVAVWPFPVGPPVALVGLVVALVDAGLPLEEQAFRARTIRMTLTRLTRYPRGFVVVVPPLLLRLRYLDPR